MREFGTGIVEAQWTTKRLRSKDSAQDPRLSVLKLHHRNSKLKLPTSHHHREASEACFRHSTMRKLASQLSTQYYYTRRNPLRNVHSRNFSSFNGRVADEVALEQDAERKIGWMLKLFFAGTASYVGYQFFPYLGDNLMQQSVSLLQVKDPLFKRMGASRLARFAIDDERRMKIVEMGGACQLLNMLEAAKDDRTRKEALKALSALSQSDEAVGALNHAGAISIIRSIPDSFEDADVEKFKSNLMKRFKDLRYIS